MTDLYLSILIRMKCSCHLPSPGINCKWIMIIVFSYDSRKRSRTNWLEVSYVHITSPPYTHTTTSLLTGMGRVIGQLGKCRKVAIDKVSGWIPGQALECLSIIRGDDLHSYHTRESICVRRNHIVIDSHQMSPHTLNTIVNQKPL